MKKILVTGAGGYIGRHVVKALLDKGAEVIAVDLYTEGIDQRAKILNTDIFSGEETLYQKLCEPEVCLHMAWKDGFVHNSNAHMEMLSAHYRFIRHRIEHGTKHIAVMGTMHEVGYYEGAIDENTPCNPRSMYGIAKDALRRSTFALLEGTDVVLQWLRAYYIFGDDKKNHSIFAKLIQAEEEGKEFFPFTSGKNKYDFITVDELANQIATCVMQTEVTGVINCCSGNPISLAEQVEDFIKKNNFKIKLQYGAFPDRVYDSPAVWGNEEKINKIMRRI